MARCRTQIDAHLGRRRDDTRLQQRISADDNYYGSFDSSYIVREFSLYDQLEDIVELASKPLPERPDGIVAVAKFTSANNKIAELQRHPTND